MPREMSCRTSCAARPLLPVWLWATGDTRPFILAVAATRAAGEVGAMEALSAAAQQAPQWGAEFRVVDLAAWVKALGRAASSWKESKFNQDRIGENK